jgi:hypothetical protein
MPHVTLREEDTPLLMEPSRSRDQGAKGNKGTTQPSTAETRRERLNFPAIRRILVKRTSLSA